MVRPRLALGILLIACVAPAQEAPNPPLTVAIVGASASAGFSDQLVTANTPDAREHNATIKLQRALLPLFAEGEVRVKDCSDVTMFLHAEKSGEHQVERALRVEPDVVVAIDFLFWFGYSIRGGDRAARLRLQDKGLAVLARIDRPLLVGDYPAMADIDPRMLHPRAVPDAATLAELNERLRAWAASRPHVRVFPLDRLQRMLRTEKCVVELGADRFELEADDLLQTDHLHVTKLGMAVLVSHVSAALPELAPSLPALRPHAHTLADIVRALDLADAVRLRGTRLEAQPASASKEPVARPRR
ncbi:MAG: hypothetical protein R3F56_02700 [Planctomycetota bacterium]